MKKKLILIFSLVIIMVLLAACGKESYKFTALQGGPALTDPVTGNNSFVVKKGDYIYMVNGGADVTLDNTFSKPVKGAIYRLKLSSTGEIEETLVMAPKMFYSRNQGDGLYIEKDKLYYISPSTKKDKQGNFLYYYSDIMSVNLNGTGTKMLATVDYYNSCKFVTINDSVYFVYEKPDADDESILRTYAVSDSGKSHEVVDSYQQALFSDDGYVYYTKAIPKAEGKIEGNEDFNRVYKKAIVNGTEEEVLNNGQNVSLDKYTVTLKEIKDNVLYYSKNISAGTTPLNIYFAYRDGKESSGLTYSEYADPYFLGFDSNGNYKGTLFYTQSQLVLFKPGVAEAFAVTSLDSQPQYLYMESNVLYFILSDNIYSVDVFDSSGDIVFNSKTKLSTFSMTINYEKLLPVILDNYLYFIGTVDEVYYSGYVYRFDLNKADDEEYVPERIGVMSQDDIKLEEEANEEETSDS